MINKIKSMKITKRIIALNITLYMFFGLIVYPLIPYLLNYPPNSIDTKFQSAVVGMQYTNQFILLMILGIVVNVMILYFFFRKLDYWKNSKDETTKNKARLTAQIRDICANGIYKLLPIHSIVICSIVVIVLSAASTEFGLTLKLAIIITIWSVIADLLLYVFCNKVFYSILRESYYYIDKKDDKIVRMSIKDKMTVQSLATILVILAVMTFFGYSRITYERGEFLKEVELNKLANVINDNKDNLINYIKQKQEGYFIMDENFKVIYDNYGMSKFATEYIRYYPELNRTYFQYGSDVEGVNYKVSIDGKTYYVGKMFQVMPLSYTAMYFSFNLCLLLIYILITSFFSRNVKNELENLSHSLHELLNNDEVIGKELPITSNDEISDLIDAYNKIQKKTKGYIDELETKQEIIVKQGQLASIGELAGGVAHDINTPISAIKSGILMFREMLGQRSTDEAEILKRMDNCADKIINIVNSMRNQMRNLGGTTKIDFKVSDVIEDIRIITYNEFNKNNCKLEVEIQKEAIINGDPTKLGQVLTNLLVNAIQAYNKKEGIVKVILSTNEDNMVLIKVSDNAGGIAEDIQEHIFKSMLTTKGTVGTGFGLYLAYSVIKGVFGGEITFESVKGVGTTFSIKIPLANNTYNNV